MQIIRENCFECVGPKRDACDALFEGVRTNVANMCREGAELMLNDSLVGIMELQEKSASQCAETAVALRGLGCTLSDEDARTALLSEYLIAVDLATFELEEEDRKEQEKIDEAGKVVGDWVMIKRKPSCYHKFVKRNIPLAGFTG